MTVDEGSGGLTYVHAGRPWLRLFDEVLVPRAMMEYGLVPQHWMDARRQLEEVDAGRAWLVLHLGGLFLLRGVSLEDASNLQGLLRHLRDAGARIEVHEDGERGGHPGGPTPKRARLDVEPRDSDWVRLVFILGERGPRSEWWWYWMLRLAWRLDTGRAAVRRGSGGRLWLNGWWRCRRLERSLQEARKELVPAYGRERWSLPDGVVQPRQSWLYLFRRQFESCIPRWSTVLPIPWRLRRRRLLRHEDPAVVSDALHGFPLPLRWQRLRRVLGLVDQGHATVHAMDGLVYVERRGRRCRHRLLEDAIYAWTEPTTYGPPLPGSQRRCADRGQQHMRGDP